MSETAPCRASRERPLLDPSSTYTKKTGHVIIHASRLSMAHSIQVARVGIEPTTHGFSVRLRLNRLASLSIGKLLLANIFRRSHEFLKQLRIV